MSKISVIFSVLFYASALWGQAPANAAPTRIKVSEYVAATLIEKKFPLVYPEAARNDGTEGTVVLGIVTDTTGNVSEATVESGNPTLAQAALESVKRWKYKPYTVNGAPAEMETRVTVNFRLSNLQPAPPMGNFRDGAYNNEYFGITYAVSQDWVRETEIMRKRLAASPSPGTYVLLAAVHIPQRAASVESSASFVVYALKSTAGAATEDCPKYLTELATELHSSKDAERNGEVTSFTVDGREYYRADFHFRDEPCHRAFICSKANDYLLRWNIGGTSKAEVDQVASTVNDIKSIPVRTEAPAAPDVHSRGAKLDSKVTRVKVGQGVTQGMVIKRVQPTYPEEARRARIQGSVVLSAVVDTNGNVIDLEALDGPPELVVSAVKAVRQWKYRPYILNGQPVEVSTQITVNYTLTVR